MKSEFINLTIKFLNQLLNFQKESFDIFICDEFSKGLKVIQQLREKFKPEKSEFFYIERAKESIMNYKPIRIEH